MRAILFLVFIGFTIKVFSQTTTNKTITNSQPDKSQGGVTLPDGTFIPNAPKKVSDKNNNQVAAVGPGSTGVVQDGSSKVSYDSMKGLYERQKALIPHLPQEERPNYHHSMGLLEAYFKAYDEGNVETARQLFDKLNEEAGDLIKNKPIVAFRYNELFKTVLSSNVKFGIYKDSNDLYLQVGQDAFCTVSTLSTDNIVGILQAFDKAIWWPEQCYNEKMEVNKPLGSFGGVTIEFDSQEEGRFCRFLINIKGETSSDRLISEQTVWMSVLNFSCLVDKMRNAPELYKKRIKAHENAIKLK